MSMVRIPSKLGHDLGNETFTRGMNLKKHFTIVLCAVRRRPQPRSQVLSPTRRETLVGFGHVVPEQN